MLVLSRKAEQSIIIGDQIKVVILGVRGNAVRVGVEAPDTISIRRMELPKQNEQGEAVVNCHGFQPADRSKSLPQLWAGSF